MFSIAFIGGYEGQEITHEVLRCLISSRRLIYPPATFHVDLLLSRNPDSSTIEGITVSVRRLSRAEYALNNESKMTAPPSEADTHTHSTVLDMPTRFHDAVAAATSFRAKTHREKTGEWGDDRDYLYDLRFSKLEFPCVNYRGLGEAESGPLSRLYRKNILFRRAETRPSLEARYATPPLTGADRVTGCRKRRRGKVRE